MFKKIFGGDMVLNYLLKDCPNFFKFLQREFVHGGYLTALGAPALVLTTTLISNKDINIPLLMISYLLPLIVYSYDYMGDLDKDAETNTLRSQQLMKKKKYYPLLLLFYVSLLVVLLLKFSNEKLMIFIILITLGGLLYATILKKLTKRIPIFKNIYTVLTWALGGTFFVPLHYSLAISAPFIFIFIFINLKGMVNAVFFDLKDSLLDSKEGLKTLPVMMGKPMTIKLLHLLNFVAFLPIILGVYIGIIPPLCLSLIIFYFYSFYYLKKAQGDVNEKSLVILGSIADIEFIFWPLILIIALIFLNPYWVYFKYLYGMI